MTDFHVHGRRDVGFDSLRVDVLGPSPDKRVNVEKRLMGDGSMRYMYTPVESGTHTVSIKHVGKHIPNSPFTVQVFEATVANMDSDFRFLYLIFHFTRQLLLH